MRTAEVSGFFFFFFCLIPDRIVEPVVFIRHAGLKAQVSVWTFTMAKIKVLKDQHESPA